MITERDIREKTFAKATFGGYDMSEVDDFLEEMAASVAGTQKEFGTLRGKMKVLVDKIEEYRSTEDAMRLALISAQKVAKEVETEAKERAEAIVAEANARAEAIVAEANARAEEIAGDLITRREMEERRLHAATEASADYIEKMLNACRKQSEFLTALGAVTTPVAESAVEESRELPVEEEEDGEAVVETVEALPVVTEEAPAPAEIAAEESVVTEASDEWTPDGEVDEPTRMFRF